MHGLFGHIRALHEVSNFHEIIPREESSLIAMIQTGVLIPSKSTRTLIAKREKFVKKNFRSRRFFLTFLHSI
jgi:hypothetical protein